MSVQEATALLVAALRESGEHADYVHAKELALQNETTRGLYLQFRQLQLRLQAETLAGRQREDLQQQYRRLYELLLFDEPASALLLAEHRIQALLGEVYKTLAQAVDISLDMLEE